MSRISAAIECLFRFLQTQPEFSKLRYILDVSLEYELTTTDEGVGSFRIKVEESADHIVVRALILPENMIDTNILNCVWRKLLDLNGEVASIFRYFTREDESGVRYLGVVYQFPSSTDCERLQNQLFICNEQLKRYLAIGLDDLLQTLIEECRKMKPDEYNKGLQGSNIVTETLVEEAELA